MQTGQRVGAMPAAGGKTAEGGDSALPRGSNQSSMRAHNERLVLSLLRENGVMAKSDIARATHLSAQTVSVIVRGLEDEGLIARGEPQRGRIGQPSVPMSLAPDGVFFLGLKIGRRSTDLLLTDFVGQVRANRREVSRVPTPASVLAFLARELPQLLGELDPALRGRVAGAGVAMPSQLWAWPEHIGAAPANMEAWRHVDMRAEVAALVGVPTWLQNDASAACGAEMVFGRGERPRDSLYFYIGYFVGGGLTLDGRLFTGRTGNAGGVASMPVPMVGPAGGRMGQLVEIASLATLASAIEARGLSAEALWHQPEDWQVPEDLLSGWLDQSAEGLAAASVSACALLELEAVTLEGWLPRDVLAELVRRTDAALDRLNLAGIARPRVRAGTVGPYARALGAAAVPLAQRYLITGEGIG